MLIIFQSEFQPPFVAEFSIKQSQIINLRLMLNIEAEAPTDHPTSICFKNIDEI